MSHKGTNWAIQQRGLKPAAKIVLWHLCDRHNPDYGCFPEQALLADDCEMSRSTLNVHLKDLEERGLIRREQRWNRETKKQERTHYRLGFEDGFKPAEAAAPCPETGHGKEKKTVSGNDENPCPENGQSRVRNPDTINPVREPVKEPVNEREGASERVEAQEAQAPEQVDAPEGSENDQVRTPKQVERMFWKLVKNWPNLDGMPKQRALSSFEALSADDQDAALEHRDSWFALLRSQHKKFTPAPSSYCSEKLWKDIPDGFAKAGGEKAFTEAKPFGKGWGVVRFADLMQKPYGPPQRLTATQEKLCASGHYDRAVLMREKLAKFGWPRVNMLQERAVRQHRGAHVPVELSPLLELFGKVSVGSALWNAWQDLHSERGWPWFDDDLGRVEWVYFPEPPDPPDSYPDLLEAVRAAVTRFELEHAHITRNEAAE